MILLDLSFGLFAFAPEGWIFMVFVIILECLVMTRLLLPKWYNKKIYLITTLTNIISGLLGITISMTLEGVRSLVIWFPWVGNKEFPLIENEGVRRLIIFYSIAFILTLIIETIITVQFLRKYYPTKRIVKAIVIANILSYTVGTFVLYSYSFH